MLMVELPLLGLEKLVWCSYNIRKDFLVRWWSVGEEKFPFFIQAFRPKIIPGLAFTLQNKEITIQ